jgi:hypothetical protein
MVLAVVVACSAFLGFATFHSLAGIRVAADGLAETSQWSWGVLLGLVATFVAAVVAVVCLVRTQSPRLVAAISVVAAVMLPLIAAFVGLRWGFDVASQAVGEDISALISSAPGTALIAWLTKVVGD